MSYLSIQNKNNQKELEERVIMLGKDSNENNHNNIQISKI